MISELEYLKCVSKSYVETRKLPIDSKESYLEDFLINLTKKLTSNNSETLSLINKISDTRHNINEIDLHLTHIVEHLQEIEQDSNSHKNLLDLDFIIDKISADLDFFLHILDSCDDGILKNFEFTNSLGLTLIYDFVIFFREQKDLITDCCIQNLFEKIESDNKEYFLYDAIDSIKHKIIRSYNRFI